MTERTHSRLARRILAGLLVVFVLFQVVAFHHARAFLFFTEGGEKTRKAESLTPLQKMGVLLTGVRNPRPRLSRTPGDLGLAFESYKARVDEKVRIALWHIPVRDSRGLVLLFHGYTGTKSDLLDQAKVFQELGYSTLLVDFRGSGDSSESYTTVGFEEAKDVAAAVEFAAAGLRERPRRLILYGISMGGAAVMRAVALGKVQPERILVEVVFDRLITTTRRRFDLMGVPSWPAAESLLFWAGRQVDLDPWSHDPVEYAARITTPALVLHAAKDPRATREQGEAVHQAFAGSKHLVMFEKAVHQSLVEADPVKWKEEVSRFLDPQ